METAVVHSSAKWVVVGNFTGRSLTVQEIVQPADRTLCTLTSPTSRDGSCRRWVRLKTIGSAMHTELTLQDLV